MTEMKNLLEGFNRKLEMLEGRINELEDRLIEIIQIEK